MNRTLCGCLAFTDRQYDMDKTARQVRRHYRASPACQEKARQSPVWQAREPITDDKRIAGEEHDPEYDEKE